MAVEWPKAPLGELIQNFDSRRVPLSSREREQRRGPFPYHGATGVMDHVNDFLFEGLHLLVAEDGSVETSAGKPVLQLVDGQFWVNNHAHVLRGASDEDTRFLYYALSTVAIRPFMSGSVQAKLSQGNLNKIPVPYPAGENDRRAIAHILGTLDDKIELNRRMNDTLEAMSRALFKSWFVDFDPVRAKAEGRDPGLPQALANLFPASFEDSELGDIPQGWTVGALDDCLCQRVERCTASQETAARPYVPIECISPKSLFLRESRPGVEAQSSLTRFFKGDILFGAMRPYFHKVCIAPFDGTTRTTAFVLYPRRTDDFAFATLMMHHPDTIAFATRHSTGSTIPYAVWSGSLNTMPVILPPLDVRSAFDQLMRPVLLRIAASYFENRTLATLRDALLPMLISGELRVRDAERFIVDAAQ